MEIEAKLHIPDERTFQELLAWTDWHPLVGGDLEVRRFQDIYQDTESLAFLRNGYACRIRQSDDRQVVTIKSLTEADQILHQRLELEVEIEPRADTQIDAWPESEATALARQVSDDQPLTPLFAVHQERHLRVLRSGDQARAIVELCLDRVRMQDVEATCFLELEVELLPDGLEEDLRAVVARLQQHWQLSPEPLSKFERGLALAQPELYRWFQTRASEEPAGQRHSSPPVPVPKQVASMDMERAASRDLETPLLGTQAGIQARDPMAEAVRKVLRVQFEAMLANEEGSRRGGDIEHVHDMRVATRRMRSAFRLFGSYFQPKAIKRFQKDLRATGRALGAVRDLDVFNREAQKYLKRAGKKRQHDLDPLLEHWREQRELARQMLNQYLDDDRYRRFVREFGQFLRSEGAGVMPIAPGEPVRYQVRHVLGSQIWQLYETILAYENVLEDAPVPTLHLLRIDCKRLRYTLEFFQEILGPDSPWLIEEVIAIQDHLGDLQDATVASGILSEFLDHWRASAGQDEVAGVARYLDYRRKEAQRLIDTFPRAWPRIAGLRFRRRLANAIVAL